MLGSIRNPLFPFFDSWDSKVDNEERDEERGSGRGQDDGNTEEKEEGD